MQRPTKVTRRSALVVGLSGVAALAGCSDAPSGRKETATATYDLTVSRADSELQLDVSPSGTVSDVIQLNAGRDVTFVISNDADTPVGFHNHVSQDEFVLGAGESRSIEFSLTDDMVGRHEIEGWVAAEANEHGEESDGHGDEESKTMDEHEEEVHSNETTEESHSEHEEETHAEESGGEDTHDGEDEHHGDETVSLAVVEVRPAGS
jgi:hypothetical protein